MGTSTLLHLPQRCSLPGCSGLRVAFADAVVSRACLCSELLGLEWRDVDQVRNVILVRAENEKVKLGREVPIAPNLGAALMGLNRALDPRSSVFLRADRLPHSETSLRRRHYEARASLPIEKTGLRFHDLRHTAASLMAIQGVHMTAIRAILGHADITTTQRYAHFEPGQGEVAIHALDRVLRLDSIGGSHVA